MIYLYFLSSVNFLKYPLIHRSHTSSRQKLKNKRLVVNRNKRLLSTVKKTCCPPFWTFSCLFNSKYSHTQEHCVLLNMCNLKNSLSPHPTFLHLAICHHIFSGNQAFRKCFYVPVCVIRKELELEVQHPGKAFSKFRHVDQMALRAALRSGILYKPQQDAQWTVQLLPTTLWKVELDGSVSLCFF